MAHDGATGWWKSILIQANHSGLIDPASKSHPAPQSLRRLFRDEASGAPDPFDSFAHQQPSTPSSGQGSAAVEQISRFESPPEAQLEPFGVEADSYDAVTIRQKRIGNVPSPLSIRTNDMRRTVPGLKTTSSQLPLNESAAPTPTARTVTDDGFLPAPSLDRQLRVKGSMDTLISVTTSASQPESSRRDVTNRRPGGSVGEDLKGFQFPLVGKPTGLGPGAGEYRPPPLQRNHSAAPFVSTHHESPGRAPLAHPALRPPMIRQASVAVMEGRSQAQAQALAMVQGDSDEASGDLALPRPNFAHAGSSGVAMMRSRSGSRADSESGGMALRDLLKVSSAMLRS
jgi:protein-serine/threonine kinase